MRIERIADADLVPAGAGLFDDAPSAEATARFVAEPGHHLLYAYEDEDADGSGGLPIGFVSGVETTHPDKGTEMFLSELAVAPEARRRGVGTALVRALEDLARERGCHGMWVATEAQNAAALATYRRAGAAEPEPCVTLSWAF
jgi:aminoglycoside 3-N-acetyltransferase I